LLDFKTKQLTNFFSLLTMPPQGQTQGLSYKDKDQDQDLNFVLKDSLRTRTRTRTRTTTLVVPSCSYMREGHYLFRRIV